MCTKWRVFRTEPESKLHTFQTKELTEQFTITNRRTVPESKLHSFQAKELTEEFTITSR